MHQNGALYYPYIHFRDEQWLKSTLLIFPKVFRMIPERYHPKDSCKVRDFDKSGLLDYANLNSQGVYRSLDALLKKDQTRYQERSELPSAILRERGKRNKAAQGRSIRLSVAFTQGDRTPWGAQGLKLAWDRASLMATTISR